MANIEHDELISILDRVNSWIDNCDSKASTLLSGVGVFAGILLGTDYVSKIIQIGKYMYEKSTILSISFLAITGIALLMLLIGVFFLAGVLFARVNMMDYKELGSNYDSLIFFSSIAKNQTFSIFQRKIKACNRKQMDNDYASQIYICSLICDKKFGLYKNGLIFVIIGFTVFTIMLIIGAFVSKTIG